MKQFIKALVVSISVFLLGACYSKPASTVYVPIATQTCGLNLQVVVHQGPSANRTIIGHVDFGSDTWSSFELDFVEDSGLSYPSSFSFDGQAIHFVLDTKDGRIFATGIMESNLATCSGNGGGTLSGPLVGDLGDWRGEWVVTALPIPSAQPSTSNRSSFSPSLVCIYASCLILGLLLAIYLFRLFAPYRLIALFKRKSPSKPQTSRPALRRTRPTKKSTLSNEKEPVTEYLITYTADDKLFDLSFPIEQSSKDLGECGITVAKVLDTKSSQAIAFELWLFDTQGPQTVSKILASQFCFSQADLQRELEQIGPLTLAQAEAIIVLETNRLRAEAKVLQFEYEPHSPNTQSIFKKVVIQIRVWPNGSKST